MLRPLSFASSRPFAPPRISHRLFHSTPSLWSKYPPPFEIKDELDMHLAISLLEQQKFKKFESFDPKDYGLKLTEDEQKIHRSMEKLKRIFAEEQKNSGKSFEEFFDRNVSSERPLLRMLEALHGEDPDKFAALAVDMFHSKEEKTPEQMKEHELMVKLSDPELKEYLLGTAEVDDMEDGGSKWSDVAVTDAADRALLGENPTQEELLKYHKRRLDRLLKSDPYAISYRAKVLEKAADKYERIMKKRDILRDQIAKGMFGERQLVKILTKDEIVFNNETVGSFMLLEKRDMQKWIPEGVAGDLAQEIQYIHRGEKVGFLIRPETLKVINYLDKARQAGFVGHKNYSLLHGDEGSGKSTILNEVVYWARKNGWLVLYIPDGEYWVNGEPALEESTREEFMWDQPTIAQPWCHALLQAHKDKLSTLKLKLDTSDLPAFDRNPNSTLADLVAHGAQYPNLSTDAIYHLRREINLVTEYPVLLVVDGISCFYNDTKYWDANSTTNMLTMAHLKPEKLVLARAFKNYANHGLANGALVTTTYARYKAGLRNFLKQKPLTGQHVLQVPTLRKHEFEQWMFYLEQYGSFLHPVPGGQRAMIYHMTAGRPNAAFKYIRQMML